MESELNSMDLLGYSQDEYQAWMGVVREFNNLPDVPLTINDPEVNQFINALKVWGEMLVDLRIHQSETQREIARTEALGKYLGVER